jgi:hypothetical protein
MRGFFSGRSALPQYTRLSNKFAATDFVGAIAFAIGPPLSGLEVPFCGSDMEPSASHAGGGYGAHRGLS